jgi:hypothetical protein
MHSRVSEDRTPDYTHRALLRPTRALVHRRMTGYGTRSGTSSFATTMAKPHVSSCGPRTVTGAGGSGRRTSSGT